MNTRPSRGSLDEATYCVVDVETTGFDAGRSDRVVEIAAITTNSRGEVLDEFVTLTNPGRDVGDTSVHGITPGCYAPRRRMCAGLTGVDPEQVVLLRG